MPTTPKVRLHRLFNHDKCLDVAIDHGIANEPDFLVGLEDIRGVMKSLIAAGPDAIQVNFGQADLLQQTPGPKPALVMRADVGNAYNATRHREMWAVLHNPEAPILAALQMDAAAVVVNLYQIPDEPGIFRQCIENISRLRHACDRYGMPLMIEPLVMAPAGQGAAYGSLGDVGQIVPLVRLARELGADIIKADPTDEVDEFYRVVEAARCPTLVRGGGLADLAQRTLFSPDSVVRFASVTKHLFAALVTGPAAEALALEDPLARHLPQLTGANGQVSVGQALDMIGGLPDVRETLSLLGLSIFSATRQEDLLPFLTDCGALNYPAGSEISYSNTGYRLVEEALNAKGIAFADLLQRHICAPLGIRLHAPATWFDIVPGLVPGYWRGREGWQSACAGLPLSASGSAAGSLRDLARWLQSLLGEDAEAVLTRLSAPRRLADGRETDYGLGLGHVRWGEAHLLGHGGSHPGYKTHFLLDPVQRVGMALVANREDVAPQTDALRVMAALLGQPLPPVGHSLSPGLYLAEGGDAWLEVAEQGVSWLDADETLYHDARSGSAYSLTSHLPMRLHQNGAAVEGEIGHRDPAPARAGPAAGHGL